MLIVNLSACGTYRSDNDKIAFIRSDKNENYQIYTIDSDGKEPSQLTNTGHNISLTWSPDGSKIAFSSLRSEDWEIFVMNRNGSNQINLANDGVAPLWSPDGSKIAFISGRDNFDGEFNLYIMNPDGTGQTRITSSPGKYSGYAWSPDGQKIVFAAIRSKFSWDIYSINVDGSNEINLTHSSQDEVEPRWSPKGDKIIFTSYPKSNSFGELIYIMNADGSNQKKLTNGNNGEMENDYSWSFDGSQIAYRSGLDIFMIGADGKNQRNLTASSDAQCDLPTWSPNGRKIALLCSHPPDNRVNIWVINLDDGSLKRITNLTTDAGLPIWSP